MEREGKKKRERKKEEREYGSEGEKEREGGRKEKGKEKTLRLNSLGLQVFPLVCGLDFEAHSSEGFHACTGV